MANLVITSATDYIKVEFNDLATGANYLKGYWPRCGLSVTQGADGLVYIVDQHNRAWTLSFSASAVALVVDSVNGTPPASNDALCDALGVLVK